MNNRAGRRAIEWPTLLVGLFCIAGWVAIVLFHRDLPVALTLALLAIDGAWFMSFQHELTHGHPTSSQWLNTALGWAPFALWLPFVQYRVTHTEHHRSDLTVPGVDPESFYVTRDQWDHAGPVARQFLVGMRYLPLRLLLGPAWSMVQTIRDDMRRIGRGDRRLANVWAWQLAGAGAVVWFVVGVADMPLWQYALGYAYFGMALSMVRSFAEHRAVDGETRSATVLSGRFFGLLFLNNNLHHAHHAHPGVPWYALPRLARSMGAAGISARGAGLYSGYREIFRRYSLEPFCQEIHPLTERLHPGASIAATEL